MNIEVVYGVRVLDHSRMLLRCEPAPPPTFWQGMAPILRGAAIIATAICACAVVTLGLFAVGLGALGFPAGCLIGMAAFLAWDSK